MTGDTPESTGKKAAAAATLSEAELAAVRERMVAAGVDVSERLRAELIAGGRSNLTFRLDDGVGSWVLRMPPRVGRTPSAHDVAREHRVTSALTGSDVPVARPVVLCEDESAIGLPFFVAEYVAGVTVRSDSDLAALNDGTVDRSVRAIVAALAALHRVDHVAVGLGDFGRPDAYAARQLRRWSGQWEIVQPGDRQVDGLATELRTHLERLLPPQRSTGIVHGDYRIDNTILELGTGSPRVAAIVDWELCTIGDPVADVAMMCAYRHPALDLVLGVRSAWTSDRLPKVEELAAMYEAAGGVPLDHWEFHPALAYYKIAVIAAGIDHRYRAGASVGPGLDRVAESVPRFLQAGLEMVRA